MASTLQVSQALATDTPGEAGHRSVTLVIAVLLTLMGGGTFTALVTAQ